MTARAGTSRHGHRSGRLRAWPAWLLWLIAAGLFAAGEMVSLDLVLLMFAGGALGGMAVALLGGATVLQLIAFIVVSGVLLVAGPADRQEAPHRPDPAAARRRRHASSAAPRR